MFARQGKSNSKHAATGESTQCFCHATSLNHKRSANDAPLRGQKIENDGRHAWNGAQAPAWSFGRIPIFPGKIGANGIEFPRAGASVNIGPVQTKLMVGTANDPLEREADHAVDRVMRMPDVSILSSSQAPVMRKCATCEEEEERLQKKSALTAGPAGLTAGEAPT